ncbi:MAG TPA: type I-E CRISPR-associated protein Cas6/Cse3/CasE [Rectinema sp.]|nr:type I-E CRISPR-associated protein Cas6/Cse3/CasE [Rectinema sp.]
MSWLTKIEIDASLAYKNKFIDSYTWHQALWQCFPGRSSQKRSFLTRVDETSHGFIAWILSLDKPIRPFWCPEEGWAIKEISPGFLNHRWYAFNLKANPTKAIMQKPAVVAPAIDGQIRLTRGKRVPLTKREDLKAWLERKAAQGGFKIVETIPLDIGPMAESYFSRGEQKAYHGSIQFRGVLEVTNKEVFEKTYYSGIGSAKAFGYGLLLLAPVSLN